MAKAGSLEQQAASFARQLANSVSHFLGRPVEFVVTASGTRLVVTAAPGADLSVKVGDRRILALEVSYRCQFDHANDFLAIHSSWVKVHAGAQAKGEPLFRYDYVHAANAHRPCAHIQVHAHRDQFTQAMTLAALGGAKHRQLGKEGDFEAARLSSVHFPVGGARFRPCLEDVLQMIEVEFGASTGPGWPTVRDAAREEFRRQQTGAVVRDCPSEAVRVLQSLGYTVDPGRDGPAPERTDRLRVF